MSSVKVKCKYTTTLKRSTEFLHLPGKVGLEHVQSECIVLMTRPWVEALIETGPVHTMNVAMWKR